MTDRLADDPVFGDLAQRLAPRGLALGILHGPGDVEVVLPRAAAGTLGPLRAAFGDDLLVLDPSDLGGEQDLSVHAGEDAFTAERLAVPGAHELLAAGRAARAARARPRIMGVVNATPDSFSDGGRFLDPARAVEHGLALAAEGADLLDVGGESTRPGSLPVEVEVELARVVPVVERLARETRVPISVDTRKAAVARAALDAGAATVNDVSAGSDPEMLPLVAARGAGWVAMHMRGTPETMQQDPRYGDVVAEVLAFLRARVRASLEAGIARERITVDPGIGFGKTVEHNLELLRRLGELRSLGLPVCLGVSRKSFLAKLADDPSTDRRAATLAAVAYGVLRGAEVLRVHEVAPAREAARVAWALGP
jgi:dihydropteroate synthase